MLFTMRSSFGWLLLKLTGGAAIVVASFFATLKALDTWWPLDPTVNLIHIVAATYGAACQDFTPPSGAPNQVKIGNASEAVAKVCDQKDGRCEFHVDVGQLGDPAPGCGKDFAVGWRCGSAATVHQAAIAPEAHGQTALLTCPSMR